MTKEKVRSYIFSYERGRAEDYFIDRANDFIKEAQLYGFDYAASSNNLPKQKFGPLPVNYGDTDIFPSLASSGIYELQNAGKNEQFWKTAFLTPLKSVSQPITAGDNVLVVFPLEEVIPEGDTITKIEEYYTGNLARHTDEALRNYFLNNSRLDKRFEDTFGKMARNWGY